MELTKSSRGHEKRMKSVHNRMRLILDGARIKGLRCVCRVICAGGNYLIWYRISLKFMRKMDIWCATWDYGYSIVY